MKKILLTAEMVLTALILLVFSTSVLANNEDIYGLRIENINRSGADFYWSTSIETKGSIEYAYTKLPELYNPQSPSDQVTILVMATPAREKTEDGYLKAHHIKIDNLDLNYDPFVQYTIKSAAFNEDNYTLSGEFVLVDIKKID